MMNTLDFFHNHILHWFDQHGRKNLPWQHPKTPYRVWISEIMLQQTQVKTVIPYFERFMQRFPTVERLAKASEDEVLHLFAGLGYYSRARNLHRAAQLIITQFNGEVPNTLEQLQSLPGIGPSTAGAIASIAFNQATAILDGNVKRVLARYHGITTPINHKTTEKQLWDLAIQHTPKQRCADYTQAMMDMGATLCTRNKPLCANCPLNLQCQAYLHHLSDQIPAKTKKKPLPQRDACFFIIRNHHSILLSKRPASGIWGGLWCLPEISGRPDSKTIKNYCNTILKHSTKNYTLLPCLPHRFTHYHLYLHPILIELDDDELNHLSIPNLQPTHKKIVTSKEHIWYNMHQAITIGIPKPIQTIMSQLT